jgi:hypothetical protein
MYDTVHPSDSLAKRYGTGRALAERALAAEAAGDQEEADRLFAQANDVDPMAVAELLAERRGEQQGPGEGGDAGPPQRDEEIAAMTRTVEPGQDAPSRAGITGYGSGADAEGL